MLVPIRSIQKNCSFQMVANVLRSWEDNLCRHRSNIKVDLSLIISGIVVLENLESIRFQLTVANQTEPKPAFIYLIRAVLQILAIFHIFSTTITSRFNRRLFSNILVLKQLLPTASWPSDQFFRRFFVDPQTSRLSDQLFRR